MKLKKIKTVKKKQEQSLTAEQQKIDELAAKYIAESEAEKRASDNKGRASAQIKEIAAAAGIKEGKSVLVIGEHFTAGYTEPDPVLTPNLARMRDVLGQKLYSSVTKKEDILDEEAFQLAVEKRLISKEDAIKCFDAGNVIRRIVVKKNKE